MIFKRNLKFVKRKTISEIQSEISRIVGVSGKYVEEMPNWENLNAMIPSAQEKLPTRSMEDSYDEAYLPLEKDTSLRDKFTTVIGTARIGRLLEAMDLFAVWIVLKHISNPLQVADKPTPYGIVTGHVDNISLLKLPRIKRDIVFKGHVTLVGKSSVEVYIWIEQLNENAVWEVLTKAYFIMIARNRLNTKSIPVNKLVPKNETEKAIFKEAEARTNQRKKKEQISLLKTMPNSEEQDFIHDLFIKSTDVRDKTMSLRSLPDNSVWMNNTKLSCHFFPHPENRNFHLTLFGGYIMRSILELSWITAMYHVKTRPRLIEISDITFEEPIHVGSFLLITGQVIYTDDKYIQVLAACQIEEVTTRKKHTTNTMYFTYECNDTVTKVVPQSYHEAVLLLDGKRHFEHAIRKRKTGKNK